MITVLSIDTTSKTPSISISRGEKIQIEHDLKAFDNLSSSLIPAIQFLLDNLKLKPDDINLYGIAVGPGLFTGIRVGISTLKGMVFERKKPVVPVVTTNALAHKCFHLDSIIIPLIDAKRDEVYMAAYQFIDNKVNEIIPPDLIHITDLRTQITNFGNFCFIGSGVDVHKDFIKKNFKEGKIVHTSHSLASDICQIAYYRYLKNDYISDINQLFPYYIRKPDAEKSVKKDKN